MGQRPASQWDKRRPFDAKHPLESRYPTLGKRKGQLCASQWDGRFDTELDARKDAGCPPPEMFTAHVR